MKLIFCPECTDVVKLYRHRAPGRGRACICKKSWGRLDDDFHATIGGLAVPIGFENYSFTYAIRNRPAEGSGERFGAFVIPKQCSNVAEG